MPTSYFIVNIFAKTYAKHQSISPKVTLLFHRLVTSYAFFNKIKAKSTFVNFCEYFRQDFREIYFVIFEYFCNFREDAKTIFAKRRKIKILVLAVQLSSGWWSLIL